MTQSNSNYTQQNRRAWNEIASVRATTFPPAAFFAQGGVTLDARAVDAARAVYGPDLRAAGTTGSVGATGSGGARLIHLQCATGEDTLSWANLGLQAVGVDIADQQITLANQKALDAATSRGVGLPVQFFSADIYDLPAALPEGVLGDGFDLVFTGGGALVWLPDLARWAAVVTALLRPGGRLLLMDEHPVSGCLWVADGQIKIEWDYFSRSQPSTDVGWAHFKGGEAARELKYEFSWPLGDIVTTLAQAGLIIERLEEFPGGFAFRFGERLEDSRRLPGEYLLLARKPL